MIDSTQQVLAAPPKDAPVQKFCDGIDQTWTRFNSLRISANAHFTRSPIVAAESAPVFVGVCVGIVLLSYFASAAWLYFSSCPLSVFVASDAICCILAILLFWTISNKVSRHWIARRFIGCKQPSVRALYRLVAQFQSKAGSFCCTVATLLRMTVRIILFNVSFSWFSAEVYIELLLVFGAGIVAAYVVITAPAEPSEELPASRC